MSAIQQLATTYEAPANKGLLTICKAAADPLRLDVLRVLSDESFGVLELCRIFDTTQPGMSHHLKILAGAALVETRREGNSVFYRRALIASEDPLREMVASLFETIDQMPLRDDILAGIARVYEERTESSRRFFEKHSAQLAEHQALIAEYEQYSASLEEVIRNEQIPTSAAVLEIGPGGSDLINLLARTFDRTTALDNSDEMLAQARKTVTDKHLGKVKFLLGEPEHLVRQSRRFDLVVLNMVLHHLPSPPRLFRTARELLNEAGRLLIIDLKPHNQTWARDICGDLWFGFEPGDIDDWARDAGLDKGQSVYLGLKNGFQVQIRLFHQLQPSIHPTN